MKLTKRQTKYALSLALGLISVYAWPHIQAQLYRQPAAPAPGWYRVTHDYDGDTIGVAMNGTTEKIRMIGVDTPETHKPGAPPQCYGPQASSLTKGKLLGASVRLETDPTNDNRDRYGRLLRYVYTDDNTLWNKHLIDEGAGFAYIQFPFQRKAEFMQAQFVAAAAKKGLWDNCQTHDDRGRWQTNDLQN